MTQRVFGNFILEKKIAQGGMAEIFLSRHDQTDQVFVVKRLLPELRDDPNMVDLFLTEADIGMLLRHPNIVQVLDAGEESGEYFILMEYVDGLVLENIRTECLAKKTTMPPHLACRVCIDALRGLHCAHTLSNEKGSSFGLVHRDISPANIFISRDGITKVGDFGVANLSIHGSAETQRRMHGRPRYMSPEHARQEKLDARADIYSLALVIFELLTGLSTLHTSHEAPIENQVKEVMFRKAPRIAKHAPDIPAPISRVLQKALRQKRWLRFDNADKFADALETAAVTNEMRATVGDLSDYARRFLK